MPHCKVYPYKNTAGETCYYISYKHLGKQTKIRLGKTTRGVANKIRDKVYMKLMDGVDMY